MSSHSPLMLPVRALDLLRRYGLVLLCVFTAGHLLHDLALRGAALLAQRNVWLGFSGLSVSVLVLLGTVILMFFALRHGLPNLRALAHAQTTAARPTTITPSDDKRMVDVIAESVLPFLIFYGAWGLFTDEVRVWSVNILNQAGMSEGIDILNRGIAVPTGGGITSVDQLFSGPLAGPLAIAAGSWIVRAICQKVYELRGSRIMGLLTALFEANFMFFAVISVSVVVGAAFAWVGGRVAVVDTVAALTSLVHGALPGPLISLASGAWGQVSPYVPDLSDGLLQPLLWLTITAVVFGEAMDRDEAVLGDSRFAKVGGLFLRLPHRVQVVSEFFSREWRDKYTPLVNGLRFALSAGPLLFLTFALCYTALQAGQGYLEIGIARLVGPHEWDWWFPWLGPLNYVSDAVYEILRVTLLAAMFDMTLGRGRIRSAAERSISARTPAPAGPRSATA